MIETFRIRKGIGRDWDASCFVCGARTSYNELFYNISGFVLSCRAARAIIQELPDGSVQFTDRLGYRKQLRVYACPEHLANLKRLQEMIWKAYIIFSTMIEECQLP